MIDEQYIDLVTAYLEDSLAPDERAEFNSLIRRGEIDIIDLKEMETLYQKTGDIRVPEPGRAMRSNFYRMLEKEKVRQQSTITARFFRLVETVRAGKAWKTLAVACIALLIGILIGNLTTPLKNYNRRLNNLSRQVTQMRQIAALNLLDNSSAITRLKAVNISMEIPADDHRITNALLKTLNNDPNVNVRLAAVEALVNRGGDPVVRQGLVRSIDTQQSPLVQVALADAMLALQETNSVKKLKKLLHKDDLDPTVKQKIQHTIAALS